MVFEYLNHPKIWSKFCNTYEALWELFGEFDDFYVDEGQGLTIPSLQEEWKKYMEVVLSSLVKRTQRSFTYQVLLAGL